MLSINDRRKKTARDFFSLSRAIKYLALLLERSSDRFCSVLLSVFRVATLEPIRSRFQHSVPPQLQLQPIEGARGPWGWPRAPRGLCLRRRENGFGFTLRHFIVYPPESYT
ncbi:hypothetical protein J437_LFUL008499, partial [Ladona fulva]